MTAKLSPLWKQAILELLKLEPQPGYLIAREWLDDQFGLEVPGDNTTRKKNQDYAFAFLASMTEFRKGLLEGNQIALRTVIGRGYEIIPPAEQTKHAMREGHRSIAREFGKMNSLLINVNHDKLTTSERKENADALARAAMMQSMYKRGKTMKLMEGHKQIESYV